MFASLKRVSFETDTLCIGMGTQCFVDKMNAYYACSKA